MSAAGAEATLAAMTANISGGRVEAAGAGDAIASQTVDIKGGTISARWGLAVQIGGAGSVKVSNGFVFAFGTGNAIVPNVIKMDFNAQPEISGNAVVCVWSNPGGKPVFTEGTSTDLSANSGSSVVWAQEGSLAGISYLKGNNKGFFAIGGVITTEAETTSTSTEAPTKVTISTSTDEPSETTDESKSSAYSSSASEIGTLPAENESESQANDVTTSSKENDISGNRGNAKSTFVLLWIGLVVLALLLIAAVVIILIMKKKK
ncbi:MAG: hypothetical protein GX763_05585 [Clostridiaceae bacterium]|nr:hypothetical protein [Clostridiaceae bacterium]